MPVNRLWYMYLNISIMKNTFLEYWGIIRSLCDCALSEDIIIIYTHFHIFITCR